MPEKKLTGYLAADGFLENVQGELKNIEAVYGRLVLAKGKPQKSWWSQNIWYDPVFIKIKSITDAAERLTDLQRNWCLYPYKLHRRAELIKKKLPYFSQKPLAFPSSLPRAPLGSWTLLENDLILAAKDCSSPFPDGEVVFKEDKSNPPSRAYLKLWETFTLIEKCPKPGDFCLDLGGSPGGWTWVLAKLGAEVLCVDRSPLDPKIGGLPGIAFQKGNAFSQTPDLFEKKVDWIFSDVICYPEKLFTWLQKWFDSGKCTNFVCTIKFQGDGHYEIIDKFASIPGARVIHLFNNKHELTWVLLG